MDLFQKTYLSSSLARNMRGIFSDLYSEDLMGLLKVKLMNAKGSTKTQPLEFLTYSWSTLRL